MAFIEWSLLYETGIKEIDSQHKKLVHLINLLSEYTTQSQDVIKKTLRELVDYTGYHFSTEENLMKKYYYPDFEEHEKAHGDFIRKVIEFHSHFLAGKENMNQEILNFLVTWLIGHILETDKKLASYVLH